jgi:hypothetical protein
MRNQREQDGNDSAKGGWVEGESEDEKMPGMRGGHEYEE